MATPGVGEDIEDVCTRCGDTWHVVMAKLGDRVAKVVCKLCGSQHNYRSEKNTPVVAASAWTRPRRRRFDRAKATPPASVTAFDPSKPPRGYSPKDSYLPGERLIHATFGVGVVASIPGPGKVDVQFAAGMRTMACAKATARLERPIAVEDVPVPDSPEPKVGRGRS
ncbi:MAG: hypothetical protein JXP73_02080 [Deltaproteobacteria bacterium]|nr:hypothetical protein [Deltaproteobacteria bacterium]